MSHDTPLPLVLALDDATATLERVGGKGASLARLVRAGLPVPPGFHITTAAYRRFVQENGFGDAILTAATQAQTADPASLERAAAEIQSIIGRGTIPDDIAALIRQWYGNLGDNNPAVAVRSSATAEDLPELSFAGQQETYLNVRGGENVLAAVKRCWASLWTARAIGYRARQGIHSAEVSLAVVVQQLVPAEAAGILFTANPLTGSHDEMMINAAWGLGEAIVGGQVTPDTLVVNKQTGALIFQEITDKAVMTVRVPSGTREEATPAAQRTQAALQPAQAAELARLGMQIERLYGQPMDIEWARHEGRFLILQARPITALPEAPATLSDFRPLVAERRAVWARAHAVTPPVTLPVKGGARFMGFDFSRLMPAHTDQAAGGAIKGIGASPGRVVGVARVIHGPGEFDQMQQGDILVAKITTPAWTPLFALAAGVVTDVGGPLSHSSIVAREYHIPAVLGTGVATARLHSGQRITVDGDNGVVMLRT